MTHPRLPAALVMLALLVWLAVAAGWTAAADRAAAIAIGGAGDGSLWARASRMGDTEVRFILAGVVAALGWMRRDWRVPLFLLLAVPGGALANEGLKALAVRPRPEFATAHGWSFPSGHAAGAAVLAGAATLLAPVRWRIAVLAIGAILAVAIGLSRVALGVHYLSDVIAGWLTGAAWLLLAGSVVGVSRSSPDRAPS